MNTFPNNLKRLRKASGLKQEELAERLNVTRQTVSGWETGRRQPDLDTLKLLAETLEKYLGGEIKPVPQDEAASSYEPMLDKDMGLIDWAKSASEIACQVRGLNPWPCAFTDYAAGRLKVYLAKPADVHSDAAPGTVIASGAKEGLIVACGEGCLELLEIQAPNAKRMTAKAYLMGKKIDVGTRFGVIE